MFLLTYLLTYLLTGTDLCSTCVFIAPTVRRGEACAYPLEPTLIFGNGFCRFTDIFFRPGHQKLLTNKLQLLGGLRPSEPYRGLPLDPTGDAPCRTF